MKVQPVDNNINPDSIKKKFTFLDKFSKDPVSPLDGIHENPLNVLNSRSQDIEITGDGRISPGSAANSDLASSGLLGLSLAAQSFNRPGKHFKQEWDDDDESSSTLEIRQMPGVRAFPLRMLSNVPELDVEEEGVSPSFKENLYSLDSGYDAKENKDELTLSNPGPKLSPPLKRGLLKLDTSLYESGEYIDNKKSYPFEDKLSIKDIDDIIMNSSNGSPSRHQQDIRPSNSITITKHTSRSPISLKPTDMPAIDADHRSTRRLVSGRHAQAIGDRRSAMAIAIALTALLVNR